MMRSLISLAAIGLTAATAVGLGAVPVNAATSVYVWGTSVNARGNRSGDRACLNYPSVQNCPDVIRTFSQQNILAYCQKKGQPVSDNGYYSEWWTYAATGEFRPSAWVSNVYIRGNAHLDGVPDCTW